MSVVAVIPAHLASVRFPRKILFPFFGLPMIEHVRRRALLSKEVTDVLVATCDSEIADVIDGYGGNVIMTSDTHNNGTSRVAEAIENVDASHVILLQGDEPLLLPHHIDLLATEIKKSPGVEAWNATGRLEKEEELDKHSFVKCAVNNANRILFCFRRSPCFSDFHVQQEIIRKILGIIAYKKEFLLKLKDLPQSNIEKSEFIEQMRIIENGYMINSVPVEPALPSVNEPSEVKIVIDYINANEEQKILLDKILS